MRRREFISLLGGAAIGWPIETRAQRPASQLSDFWARDVFCRANCESSRSGRSADAARPRRRGDRNEARSEFLRCLLLSGTIATPAATENAPGVTDREIKIGQTMPYAGPAIREIRTGQTMPYTGPAAQFFSPGLAEKAYMQMINDQGGINGRKINLISVDDGYLPWRTGNETRKLVEVEHVAFMFGSIGTPTQLAVAKYLNDRKIPQLFIDSGALSLGRLQGHALHDRRRAPELPTGSAFVYPPYSPAKSKRKDLHPL